MLHVSLIHDGQVWTARNEDFAVSAPTLPRLDGEVRRFVRSRPEFNDHKKVFMAFDNSTIPGWIRQYMPHYFNRIIDLNCTDAQEE